jgi:hypothetical protein
VSLVFKTISKTFSKVFQKLQNPKTWKKILEKNGSVPQAFSSVAGCREKGFGIRNKGAGMMKWAE